MSHIGFRKNVTNWLPYNAELVLRATGYSVVELQITHIDLYKIEILSFL